jgi:hypothetical protein
VGTVEPLVQDEGESNGDSRHGALAEEWGGKRGRWGWEEGLSIASWPCIQWKGVCSLRREKSKDLVSSRTWGENVSPLGSGLLPFLHHHATLWSNFSPTISLVRASKLLARGHAPLRQLSSQSCSSSSSYMALLFVGEWRWRGKWRWWCWGSVDEENMLGGQRRVKRKEKIIWELDRCGTLMTCRIHCICRWRYENSSIPFDSITQTRWIHSMFTCLVLPPFQIIRHFKNLRESKHLKFKQNYRENYKNL